MKQRPAVSRPLILALAILLALTCGVALWESDWMLERQAAHADRSRIADMARRMPNSEIVQYYYGRSLAQEGRTDDAIAALQRAANANPASARTVALLGDQMERAARFLEAGALLESFARRHPADPQILVALGVYYFRVYDRQQAVDSLTSSVRLAPNDVRAWRLLGEAELALGQPMQAADAYTKALALVPGDVNTLLRRATAWSNAYKPDQAESDLRAALKTAPGNVDVRYALASLLALQNPSPARLREAIQILRQMNADGAPLPQIHRELGRALSQQQRWVEAEAELRTFTTLMPDEPDGLYLYAIALRRQRKPDAAIMARYRAAKAVEETRRNLLLRVQSQPNDLRARLEQAHFLAQHGEAPFAVLCYERVLRLDPNNREARQALLALRPQTKGDP